MRLTFLGKDSKPDESPTLSLEEVDALPDEPGGWGLGLVETLAREWWTEPAGTGKWVCAALQI